jgi:hypothetical protein
LAAYATVAQVGVFGQPAKWLDKFVITSIDLGRNDDDELCLIYEAIDEEGDEEDFEIRIDEADDTHNGLMSTDHVQRLVNVETHTGAAIVDKATGIGPHGLAPATNTDYGLVRLGDISSGRAMTRAITNGTTQIVIGFADFITIDADTFYDATFFFTSGSNRAIVFPTTVEFATGEVRATFNGGFRGNGTLTVKVTKSRLG